MTDPDNKKLRDFSQRAMRLCQDAMKKLQIIMDEWDRLAANEESPDAKIAGQ